MQAYDLLMLIVLAMATIFGAIKGFAWQVASLASVVVSYVVAYRFRMQVAQYIDAQPPWNQFLAMLILYVGTSFAIWVIFRMVSGLIDRVRLKEFDRHLGAMFGFLKGLVYCLLITMFAVTLLGPKQQEAICQSRSGYYISLALDRGVGVLPKEIHDVVGPYLAKLDEKLDHRHHTHDAWGHVQPTDDGQPHDPPPSTWWQPGALKELAESSAIPDPLRGTLNDLQAPNSWLTPPSNNPDPNISAPPSSYGPSGTRPIMPPPLGNSSSTTQPAENLTNPEIIAPSRSDRLRPAGTGSTTAQSPPLLPPR
ncbi:MAG: colicin V biosynthesis protein [Pirellulaceae bacterium]|nr:MAG: colicin V biosynthesis protein [Pirellulaceae bacterium]